MTVFEQMATVVNCRKLDTLSYNGLECSELKASGIHVNSLSFALDLGRWWMVLSVARGHYVKTKIS